MRVRVGTCGFPEARKFLFRDLNLIEVQQTFYQPPRERTVQRWREEAPADFSFSLKAWQLITHPASSPTYRRLRMQLSDAEKSLCGYFQLNDLTRRAWLQMSRLAAVLEVVAIVCQTPPSFGPTDEHLDRIYRFFTEMPRGEWKIVFEPRGPEWREEILRPLLSECNLMHGVDPFLVRSLNKDWHYFRLHGLPAYHYGYRYSDEDLRELVAMLPAQGPVHVLFNNVSMAEDARRFKALLAKTR